MSPLDFFRWTQRPPSEWREAGRDTDYAIVELPDTVVLVFEGTDSDVDWKANFSFIMKPYKKQPVVWWAHRGFASCWKLAQDQIVKEVLEVLGNKKLVIIGYSHGASLVIPAHEYFWFDGHDPESHAFAPARFCWLPSKAIRGRFSKLNCYMTRGDLVTHLPFSLLGYKHVGRINKIGRNRFISHKPHYPNEYINALHSV